ncbi:MAG: 23S rRNA pseudouridine(955/2504/2580) synthase RluC [Pseudomonadota bacterium]
MEKPVRDTQLSVRHVEIDETRSGQRLDNFLLTTLKGVPKSRIYRLVRKGEVRVNRGRTKPDYRLQTGDIVRLPPVRMAPAAEQVPPERFAWLADRIIYEDEHLLAVDKPAGFAVHAGSGVAFGLIEGLRALRPEAPMLELAHRLDRDTSGCLLIAKSRPALLGLHQALKTGGIAKRYLALVRGLWRGRQRTITAALERHERGGERMVEAGEEGKTAASVFHPRTRYTEAGATLVEVELLTGRTHQARVHAAHAGHPIAGDDKYGDREFNRELRAVGLKRLFLHAWRLNFKHPLTNSKMALEAPLAPELSALLERLDHVPPV